ncbi:hypothetical protein BaRGS_00038289 [Batillaria attramentaria]|uniref:Uncharacterized protein n=1 Tax=Batillaria attramentaria TaxID=370345 RepID=A0ABD0J676_9CAEN
MIRDPQDGTGRNAIASSGIPDFRENSKFAEPHSLNGRGSSLAIELFHVTYRLLRGLSTHNYYACTRLKLRTAESLAHLIKFTVRVSRF